jgi:MFS family permease
LLLTTLLVFGSVSDYLGQRRVILAGLAMAAGATGLFLAAHGVGLLFAARALHGAAVGTATSALGAALIDLQPEGSRRAPVVTTAAAMLGLAAGGLGTSALVQYGSAPTHLVWWLLLGADLAAAVNGIGTAATVVARRASGPAAMLAGCLALLAGTAVTLAAIQTTSGSGRPDLPPTLPRGRRGPTWPRRNAMRTSASPTVRTTTTGPRRPT